MGKDINGSHFFVGIKQSTEAILSGKAEKAYIAKDADQHVKLPFIELCKEHVVPIFYIDTKEQLGKLCGIEVGAACAVVLRQ